MQQSCGKNLVKTDMKSRLNKDFFDRGTLTVAKELLGKILVFRNNYGIITETEAYIGQNDPACHASRGLTKRTAVMFGDPGFSYVYLIYGMYHCLNFTTESHGKPAAVLIRGCYIPGLKLHLDGPGKLCRHFGLTRDHNAIDITTSKDFYVLNNSLKPKFKRTPRIGIKVGLDKNWRFIVSDHLAIG